MSVVRTPVPPQTAAGPGAAVTTNPIEIRYDTVSQVFVLIYATSIVKYVAVPYDIGIRVTGAMDPLRGYVRNIEGAYVPSTTP